MAFVDHQSGDHCHGDETDDVATGRTGKLADSACEPSQLKQGTYLIWLNREIMEIYYKENFSNERYKNCCLAAQ